MNRAPRTKGNSAFRASDQALAIGILLAAFAAAFFFNILRVGSEPMLCGVFLAIASGIVFAHRGGLRKTEESENTLRETLGDFESRTALAAADTEKFHQARLSETRKAHEDLLSHHKFTKRMLQSRRPEDVFEALLQGVRDGLGFRNSLIGTRDDTGQLVFRGDGVGGEDARIAPWSEGSPLAQTFWSAQQVILQPDAARPLPEADRRIVGDGPAFVATISRRPNRKCSDVKQCGATSCLSYEQMNPRCWSAGAHYCVSGANVSLEERRRVCANCEMFSPKGLLVVKGGPDSRMVEPGSIGGVVALAAEASLALEVVELFENLRSMSVTDGLTGLTNHREFYVLLKKELERSRRYGSTVSVLIIDVDDFKKFNDRYGHLAGDLALKKIAELLKICSRGTDTVARYGGEEFALILPESTTGGALMVAERIKTDIGLHDFLPCAADAPVRLTVSVGIFSSEGGVHSEDQVVSFADEAAYQAKFAGKNRVMVKGNA